MTKKSKAIKLHPTPLFEKFNHFNYPFIPAGRYKRPEIILWSPNQNLPPQSNDLLSQVCQTTRNKKSQSKMGRIWELK